MTTFRLSIACGVALLLAACSSRPSVDPAALVEQVRATEAAFARTMADRDHAAFTTFLADEAIFVASDRALRGKEAIAAGWKRFYDDVSAPFAWQPEQVQVLDSGTLALSSGPVFAPNGARVGTFNSVWRRERDGAWKIVLDNGCPDCACAVVAPARL